jgi:hypothetical protein
MRIRRYSHRTGIAVHEPDPFCGIEGHQTNLEWSIGFTLRFVDRVAEVVDPDGNVVVRDGGQLSDAGGGTSARGDGWFSVCVIDGRFYTSRTDP